MQYTHVHDGYKKRLQATEALVLWYVTWYEQFYAVKLTTATNRMQQRLVSQIKQRHAVV